MELYDILTNEKLMALAEALNRGETVEPGRLSQAGVSEADHAAFRRCVATLRTAANHASRGARPCLDDNLLAEYVDGALARTDRTEVERHLAACPTCLDEAVSLASLVREVAPAPPLTEVALQLVGRGLHWIARPMEGFREEMLAPVPVLSTTTEETSARRWTQTVGDLTLRFTATAPECDMVTLIVETIGASTENVRGARLTLTLDGAVVESRPLDSDGRCVLHNLTQGNYMVELRPGGASGARFPLRLVLNED